MLKRIVFVLVVLSVITGFVFAGGRTETTGGKLHIVIATDATWPPMEMVDENKEIVGFDIDLMNAAAEAGGFTVEFQNTAWDGIWAGLAAGEYDAVMSSVTITEERKKTMDFSVPYINAGQVLIVPKATTGVTTLADLKGKTAAAQIGTTGSFEIEKVSGVELRTYDEIGLAFEDMANGRVDAVVADTPVAADFALMNPNYKDRFKIVGEPFTDEFYGVAVDQGNKEVLDAINKGLSAVLNTDTYKKIEEKWLR
ncbi:MAG: basic amino acid ABC transporter substrate-binding protein [Spirochaetaceae bacterium]|nr:MAG: basic amino acid ABC transporter substrate-binding protein [Spirochaetaceae bacterium]